MRCVIAFLVLAASAHAQFVVDQPFVVDSTPDAAMASRSQPQTSGGDKPAASGVRLQFWSASWCGYCPPAKAEAERAAAELGITLEVFDWDRHSDIRRRVRVTRVPTLFVVQDGKISDRRRFVGFTSKTRIVESARGTKSRTVTTQRERLPVVQTQWGTIDLETYNRPGCNCPMCQGIRSLQRSYRQSQTIETPKQNPPPSQEPTPDAMIDRMLDLMRLRESDVLADLGCGDGRILIEATKRYGCRGVGVEIDRTVANRARDAVRDAGMADQITIVTGDALEFEPSDYGVTAVSVYLYPELLEKLSPKLKRSRVVASPFHAVPGLAMTEHDGIYVYRDGR